MSERSDSVRGGREAARIVADSLERDGVTLKLCANVDRVADAALHVGKERIPFDLLLVAVGRKPRLEGFGLEGFALEDMPHIRFVGDAAGGVQFTHFAGHSGAIAAINALIGRFGRLKYDTLVPRVTFTSPEVASVGLTEAQAREQHREVEVFTYALTELDRAVIDGVGEGLVKLVTARARTAARATTSRQTRRPIVP